MDRLEREKKWGGQPYYPISKYYADRFKEKTFKISVSVSTECPSRADKTTKGCIYCDEWGSAAYHQLRTLPLAEQIKTGKEKIARRYKAKKFLVYFQSYTNTFAESTLLQTYLEQSVSDADICGFIIATRPDCINKKTLSLLKEFSNRFYLSLELGVQSFHDPSLLFLNRGHTKDDSLDAIKMVGSIDTIDVGIHLIFGLPDETDAIIKKTARQVNQLPVANVKLHNLHVLKNTPLEKLYTQGSFTPLSLEEYTRRTALFLTHLSPDIPIQRLAAVANRWEELVSPQWTKGKMRPTQQIIDYMNAHSLYQGLFLNNP